MEEMQRLEVLRRYAILDTPPEEVFDRLARMAANHFGTPIATVTFIDEVRQWFKAVHGLDIRQTGRDIAFCHHTIQSDKPMLVRDTLGDERFVGNELVTGFPKIRFYAGAPLITSDGYRIGTVSVIDTVPRPEIEDSACQFLSDLAAMVVHELEMRQAASDVKVEIERRQALEARHRAILDTAADAMLVLDEDGTIRHFNPAAERIFGYTADEAIGQDISILMPEPGRSEHRSQFDRYVATGEAHIIGVGREVIGRRKDGSAVPLDLSIAEWWDRGQRYFTGIMRDMTRRKRIEAALRKAEDEKAGSLSLMNAMLESIPDPLFFKDREGRYVIANRAVSRALRADSVVGRSDHDLLPQAEAEALRRGDLDVMENGTAVVREERLLGSSGGDERWFLTTRIPLRDDAAGVIGVVGLARDITERRAMVLELRQAKEEAEAANRAKTSFLAAASHDLRQPIQALELFTTALRMRLSDHPAGKVVDQIRQSLDALRMLLESLLDISKLDAGVVTAEPCPCSLKAMVRRLTDEYADAAAQKGLRLRHVGREISVLTDPNHLERVLRNLIENAIRYTENGGILIGCRRRGDEAVVQVFDTGIGIPQEKIGMIFHEFLQLDNPGRDRRKGLGLGLSIVRRLLALLGHRLEVKSQPGRGSCFTISLPLGAGASQVAEPAGEVADVSGATVLVIDDEAIIRQGLELLLADGGNRVLVAADAEAAVQQVVDYGAPDVIVADYRLQANHTGTEAVKAVCHACGTAVPAIIITGDTAPERIAEVQRSGHLIAHKPVTAEHLHRLIGEALARAP